MREKCPRNSLETRGTRGTIMNTGRAGTRPDGPAVLFTAFKINRISRSRSLWVFGDYFVERLPEIRVVFLSNANFVVALKARGVIWYTECPKQRFHSKDTNYGPWCVFTASGNPTQFETKIFVKTFNKAEAESWLKMHAALNFVSFPKICNMGLFFIFMRFIETVLLKTKS